MLFHTFKIPEERRNYGGSAFIEIQFCDRPARTPMKQLVSGRSVLHWKTDSLYVDADDSDIFYREYSHVFDCGMHSNRKTGALDIYGLNYYAPTLADSMIEKINEEKPEDYTVLTEWLIRSKAYNGFYILGL